ncbi:MAG: NAD(P)H-dependent oxidoreductase subunit E [Treponemataceae bacterium]
MERTEGQRVDRLDAVFDRYRGKPGALLGILEDAQEADEHRHLSEDVLRLVAERTETPLSQVYSVATFYSFFNLTPQGRHCITVCRGTACHTRGSLALLKEAAARLGFPEFDESEEPSFTTADRQFTIRTVACFGQCALAPVVQADGVIYSRITLGRLAVLLDKLRKEGPK